MVFVQEVQDTETIDSRHHQVEQNQAILLVPELLDGDLAIFSFLGLVSCSLQCTPDEHANGEIIFDYQHLICSHVRMDPRCRVPYSLARDASQEEQTAGRFLTELLALVGLVTAVLLLDAPDFARQLLLFLSVLVYLVVSVRGSRQPPMQIVVAILIALTGEIVLSAILHLYIYRDGFIPLFVPIGHGVFYAFAIQTDARFRCPVCRARVWKIVVVMGSVTALICLWSVRDQWGFLWWLIALGMILRSRNSFLLSVCFLYTLSLEIVGTSLGNWRWISEVSLFHLHSGNPPFGVGLLYCILDVGTLWVWRMIGKPVSDGEMLPDSAPVE